MKNFGEKTKRWFKSLFVQTDGNEPKMLTFVKKEGTQTVISSILCALLGILLGYIILLCINAENAGKAMGAILKNFGNFSSNARLEKYYFGSTLVKSVPLIMCGLSVMFAYKAGLFNIAALVWQLPWYACIIVAALMGALWGALSGLFKALFNVNEVIACIMTNWIGLYLTNILLSNPKAMNPTLSETYRIGKKAIIPDGGLSKLFGNNQYVTLAIIFTIIIAVIVLIVMNKTTFGYELKATGNNKFAAKYAGMKDKRNIILTMAISGALASLGAAFFYLTGIENFITASSVPAMGFNGIAVAFLGGLNPIGIVVAGFFVEHITLGGGYVDTTYYNPQVADLMIAIIIYLCAFVLFFKQFMKKYLNKLTEKIAGKTGAQAEVAADSTVTETASDASDGEINDNSETPEEAFKKEVETEVEEMPPIVDEKSGKEVDEK